MDAGAKAGATNSEAVSETNTVFNGQEVPPMKELNGNDLDRDMSKGYWYGKFKARRSSVPHDIDLIDILLTGSSNTTLLTVIIVKP